MLQQVQVCKAWRGLSQAALHPNNHNVYYYKYGSKYEKIIIYPRDTELTEDTNCNLRDQTPAHCDRWLLAGGLQGGALEVLKRSQLAPDTGRSAAPDCLSALLGRWRGEETGEPLALTHTRKGTLTRLLHFQNSKHVHICTHEYVATPDEAWCNWCVPNKYLEQQ